MWENSYKGLKLAQLLGQLCWRLSRICSEFPPPPDRGLAPRRPQNKEVLAISDDGLGRQATMCTDKDCPHGGALTRGLCRHYRSVTRL